MSLAKKVAELPHDVRQHILGAYVPFGGFEANNPCDTLHVKATIKNVETSRPIQLIGRIKNKSQGFLEAKFINTNAEAKFITIKCDSTNRIVQISMLKQVVLALSVIYILMDDEEPLYLNLKEERPRRTSVTIERDNEDRIRVYFYNDIFDEETSGFEAGQQHEKEFAITVEPTNFTDIDTFAYDGHMESGDVVVTLPKKLIRSDKYWRMLTECILGPKTLEWSSEDAGVQVVTSHRQLAASIVRRPSQRRVESLDAKARRLQADAAARPGYVSEPWPLLSAESPTLDRLPHTLDRLPHTLDRLPHTRSPAAHSIACQSYSIALR